MEPEEAELNSEDKGETGNVMLGVLTDSLGFTLRLAQIKAFDDYFRSFQDIGLSPGTISVLTIIGANPGIRQGMLAKRLRIKPANMTKTIRALEEDDLVERVVPDDDRRALELSLSAKGRSLAETFAERSLRHELDSCAPLTADEREELMRLLAKYVGHSTGEAG